MFLKLGFSGLLGVQGEVESSASIEIQDSRFKKFIDSKPTWEGFEEEQQVLLSVRDNRGKIKTMWNGCNAISSFIVFCCWD